MNVYTVADNNKITKFNSWTHGHIGLVVKSEKWIKHKTLLIPDTSHNEINDEFSFLIIPDESINGKKYHQMVVVKTRGVDKESKNYSIQKTIRFLSLISYFLESPIEIICKKTFNRNSKIESDERFSTKGVSYIDFQSTKIRFIEKCDKKIEISLALFREGLNLKKINPIYSVLSLYKIFEALNLRRCSNPDCCEITNLISQSKSISPREAKDIEIKIYRSFRCAIAHSSIKKGHVKDPDNIEDIETCFNIIDDLVMYSKRAIEMSLLYRS